MLDLGIGMFLISQKAFLPQQLQVSMAAFDEAIYLGASSRMVKEGIWEGMQQMMHTFVESGDYY